MLNRPITKICVLTTWLFTMLFPFSSLALERDLAGWRKVESIVATIGSEPVLETDILMEIDLGLLGSSRLGNDFETLKEAYLNRLLILKEVDEVGGFRLTEGQAEGAYQGYLLQFEKMEDYRKKLRMWGINEQEVRLMLRRALLASLYTESRIQFFVNILPSDIEKTYEEERDRWGDATLYEAWESIRSYLLQSTYQMERDRWLATLRERYDLNVDLPEGASDL